MQKVFLLPARLTDRYGTIKTVTYHLLRIYKWVSERAQLLNLIKLQEPEDWRKNQYQTFNSAKIKEKTNKEVKTSLMALLRKGYNKKVMITLTTFTVHLLGISFVA